MKSEDLKILISQIKKYDLTKKFNNTKEFDKWLSKLTKKQIRNFNSLTIDPSKIMFPMELIINENLLNCDDYIKRIESMSKLKNGEGCWHLFDRLCSPNFLNSQNYYKDIEMISKANTARYALWVVNEDAFINSKYHEEDLKLIVEAKDTPKYGKNQLDWLVAEALATVASNISSIKSPYHQEDMKLIATSGSECLEMTGSCIPHGLNNLAIDEVSLKDKYHLENMKILAKNSETSKFLYEIMTTHSIIKGKNYRYEIDALANAKDRLTALAIYCYIINPEYISFWKYFGICDPINLKFNDSFCRRENNIKGKLSPNYLKYLKLLNQIDEGLVMYFESLMSNVYLIDSGYQDYDLNLLLTIKDKEIFMDLYELMRNKNSLCGSFHINDVNIISKTTNKEKRDLLLIKATNKDSINSHNHEFDMQYISKLDLDSIDEERFESMRYYLFDVEGINCSEHVDILNKLYSREIIQNSDIVLDYLNNIEDNFDNSKTNNKNKVKVLSKIKGIFKK